MSTGFLSGMLKILSSYTVVMVYNSVYWKPLKTIYHKQVNFMVYEICHNKNCLKRKRKKRVRSNPATLLERLNGEGIWKEVALELHVEGEMPCLPSVKIKLSNNSSPSHQVLQLYKRNWTRLAELPSCVKSTHRTMESNKINFILSH